MCLSGTVISPTVKVALVENASSPLPTEVSLGDMFEDWQITEISPMSITIAKGDQTVKLDLSGQWTGDAEPPIKHAIKRGPMKRLHSWEARGEREPPT
jgi:hypothetical protein